MDRGVERFPFVLGQDRCTGHLGRHSIDMRQPKQPPGKVAVEQKRNEISAAPALLQGRAGPGTVTTRDALLTQRALAELIECQGGYYVMVVKRNQRRLYDELALFFQLPAIAADHEQSDRVQTVTKRHGRLETRTLECSTAGADYLV
jgi:predicted transposase YbfD/YdcC